MQEIRQTGTFLSFLMLLVYIYHFGIHTLEVVYTHYLYTGSVDFVIKGKCVCALCRRTQMICYIHRRRPEKKSASFFSGSRKK